MADIIHMKDVRNAARQLYRMLEHIEAGDILCTSDVIALSFWLVDFENLVSVMPVKRLYSLLTQSLRAGTFADPAYRQALAICHRCGSLPGSNRAWSTSRRSKKSGSP